MKRKSLSILFILALICGVIMVTDSFAYEEIDYMFERLVAAVDATGLPQLG